jgi:hypothetical protein
MHVESAGGGERTEPRPRIVSARSCGEFENGWPSRLTKGKRWLNGPTTKSPEVGWVDLDPTNGAISDDEHVTVAWGRDYSDASPLKAVILGGSAHQLSVAVEVARV